jgi:hypothetical protein
MRRVSSSPFSLASCQHDRLPVTQQPQRVSRQASLAEMLLVNRLRACTRTDLELSTLKISAAIIELTAKHWFTADIEESRLNVDSSGISV